MPTTKGAQAIATNPDARPLPDLEQLLAEVLAQVAGAEWNIAAATSRADEAAKHLLVRVIWAEKRAEIFAEELSRAKEEARCASVETLPAKAAE